MTKWHSIMALSTTKVEHISTTHTCKEAIWLKKLLGELGLQKEKDGNSLYVIAKVLYV